MWQAHGEEIVLFVSWDLERDFRELCRAWCLYSTRRTCDLDVFAFGSVVLVTFGMIVAEGAWFYSYIVVSTRMVMY